MSTRCRVAVKNPDNTYHSIYIHYDGYPTNDGPDGVGKTLVHHYTDPELVNEMISLGNASQLGATLLQTCFYGRDRKEPGTDAILAESIHDLFAQAENCGAEWIYVFENNRWKYHHAQNDGTSWFMLK